MSCLFIYRLYPGDNLKGRPKFYSKDLALQSFIAAYATVECEKKLAVVVDALELPEKFRHAIAPYAEHTIYLGGIGNSKSYLKVLELIETAEGSEYFYISEDDYLYRRNAFSCFYDALTTIPGIDYVTLYDHPDRYRRSDNRTCFGGERIFVSADCHWRTVESTCMTFGGRLRSLKKDLGIHRSFTSRANYPLDRRIWHKKQGIGRYLWRFPKRRLIAPVPSLATHLEEAHLAPIVDWSGVADQVSKS